MYKQILAEIVHFLGNLMRFSGKVNRGFVLDMIIFGECMPHPNPSNRREGLFQTRKYLKLLHFI